MKYFDLNDGNRLPAVGLGTFDITSYADMDLAVNVALDASYTYFDTAKVYNNEALLGKYLKSSGKKRGDYQIATKVWPNAFKADLCKKSIDESLRDLDTDYIDVLLLHWFGDNYDEAYDVLIDYKRQGVVKTIGVCNFSLDQLPLLLDDFERPALDQLESHLHLQDKDTNKYLGENNILHQAWSPLGHGSKDLLNEDVLIEIAANHGKTPGQIALKWNVDRGVMVLPKSVTESRIRENIDLFDFELTDADRHALASLDKKHRYMADPDDEQWLDKARNM